MEEQNNAEPASIPSFLAAPGEMAARIAAFDWANSLGSPASWPQSLKTAVGILIHSPIPIVLLWGEDGIMLYNDAYSVFAGGRHPRLLGSKVREGWPEVADFNDNVMKVGLAGGTLSYKDQELTLYRSGVGESVWMNLDYSPVIDETGRPGGVVAIVVETTERVRAERETAAERERLAQMFNDAPSFMAQLEGPNHVFSFVNQAYQALIGHRDVIGKTLREALPEMAGQGFDEVLDRVYHRGEAHRGNGVRVKLRRNPNAVPEERLVDFIYQPVRNSAGQVTGIFVEGVDVTDKQRAQEQRDVLARLTDRTRDLDDPVDVQFEAARVLGEVLVVSRVGYGTIDSAAETLTIGRDWTKSDVQSMAGTLSLQDWQPFIPSLARGERIAIADAEKDSRIAMRAAALKDRGTRSLVIEPVVEHDRLVAVLVVDHDAQRQWTADELELICQVAERARLTSERVQAARSVRENEARLRFLDLLGKETAKSLDADDILATTTRMVGEHLGVSICAYADMDPDEDGFTIRGDWSAPGSPSIVGHYSLADFGALAVDRLSIGLPLIVNDNLKELAPEEAATFQNIGITATICMPLVKEGRLTALMAIHDKAPRTWTSQELAVITEVTERSWAHIERVRAEAAVRQSEAQFRTFAQTVPNHVWTSLPNGQLDWFNDRVYAYSGHKPGELYGMDWAIMVHPDDIDEVAQCWVAAVATGRDYQIEYRLRRHDGTWRWHLARAIALRSADGTILRWIGTNTDVDDQKTAEARLEENLERRTAERDRIWQVSKDMLVVADSRGVWLSINPAWTRVLGWTESELVGRTMEWLEHPDEAGNAAAEWHRLAAGETSHEFVNRLRSRDGRYRTLSWSVVTTDDRVYAVARDVTEQRAQEAALAQAEEQLRQAQKMEAVGQLTGGIAHDFNNLLQGITGSLDRVQHRLATGRLADVERFLKAAAEAANRAASLTHRLLAFSRRQTLDPRPTDVNRLIGGMEDLIRRTMGPTISVEVVGAGGLWPARLDAPQLESALLNLCINARDAMPDGGSLTIETANKWLDDRAAKDRELPAGQYISVCVTDTGSGMTADVIARAFDPFFTTKPLGQGTGLGLSMIYGFVRQSGGQVRVYSEVGKGTTMCLYFPRFVGTADEDTSAAEEVVERGLGETVLIVDDDATVRMLVAEVLTEQRYQVLEAIDGPSALKLLETGMRIDLMITDVGLPGGMNGRQVADAARVLRRDLKVLFITGYAENAAIGNGHLDPGMAILTKPFAMSTLGNKVREMLES